MLIFHVCTVFLSCNITDVLLFECRVVGKSVTSILCALNIYAGLIDEISFFPHPSVAFHRTLMQGWHDLNQTI